MFTNQYDHCTCYNKTDSIAPCAIDFRGHHIQVIRRRLVYIYLMGHGCHVARYTTRKIIIPDSSLVAKHDISTIFARVSKTEWKGREGRKCFI